MKRNIRFELRMTQAELDELLDFAEPGKRSEFIRQAIKWQIEALEGNCRTQLLFLQWATKRQKETK